MFLSENMCITYIHFFYLFLNDMIIIRIKISGKKLIIGQYFFYYIKKLMETYIQLLLSFYIVFFFKEFINTHFFYIYFF